MQTALGKGTVRSPRSVPPVFVSEKTFDAALAFAKKMRLKDKFGRRITDLRVSITDR